MWTVSVRIGARLTRRSVSKVNRQQRGRGKGIVSRKAIDANEDITVVVTVHPAALFPLPGKKIDFQTAAREGIENSGIDLPFVASFLEENRKIEASLQARIPLSIYFSLKNKLFLFEGERSSSWEIIDSDYSASFCLVATFPKKKKISFSNQSYFPPNPFNSNSQSEGLINGRRMGCSSAIDDRVATISFKNNISAGRKFRG